MLLSTRRVAIPPPSWPVHSCYLSTHINNILNSSFNLSCKNVLEPSVIKFVMQNEMKISDKFLVKDDATLSSASGRSYLQTTPSLPTLRVDDTNGIRFYTVSLVRCLSIAVWSKCSKRLMINIYCYSNYYTLIVNKTKDTSLSPCTVNHRSITFLNLH